MLRIIGSTIKIIKSVITFILLICLVIFMVNNHDNITINFYPLPFNIETQVFLAMLFFFILGVIFGFLAFSKNMFNKSFENLKDRLKIKKLEKQIHQERKKD